MLKSLNFKHIFYFWIVARESSIKKASVLLNVSSSSISEQIKLLEYRFGLNLFDRKQKKMTLTSSGKIFFKRLDLFFPSIEEIVEGLTNHKSTDVKFLRIGLCPTLSADLRLNLCYPFIEDIHYTVKILQGENTFLLSAFDNDDIDLLFTTNAKLSLHGKSIKRVIANKQFVVVTNKTVFKSLKTKHDYRSLEHINYINYTSDSDLHFKFFDFLHQNKISSARISEIDDIGLIKATIEKLKCFSILPINSVQEELKEKKLFQVGSPLSNIQMNISAIYKTKLLSERFSNHLDLLQQSLTQFKKK